MKRFLGFSTLLFGLLTSFGSARLLPPEYHPYTDYVQALQDYERKEFARADSGNYSQIVLDSNRDTVVVGGKNYVFMLTTDNLYPIKEKKWISVDDEQRCLQRGMSKMDCQNIVKLLMIYKDQLIICGSNSLNPVYNITELRNLDNVIEGNKNGFGKCSARPSLKDVGSVTDIGEIIAGTFGYTMGNDPMVSGTLITGTVKRSRVIRTERWNQKMLYDPEFIESFSVFPSVYVFFNEKANELDGTFHATVGRVCQNDNGGSDFVLENTWTTYRKTRLHCEAKGKSDLKFTLLRSVTWSEVTKTFYALFITTKDNLEGSTVCAFSLKDVETTFDGDFLYSKGPGEPWIKTGNNKHFEGCTAKNSSLLPATKDRTSQRVPPGKQPTNFLKLQALTDSFYYQLMFMKVNSSAKVNFLKPTKKLTQIAIDDITLKNKTTVNILYVGTDYGSVVSMYQPTFQTTACILEEVALFEEDHGYGSTVRRMVISRKRHELFIGTDDKFDRLKLYNCARFTTRSACINARHPACGWSKTERKCLTFDVVDSANSWNSWEQDLSQCPSIKGTWDLWSPWVVCPQQEDREKLCKCRRRRCRSADPNACKGESIEVKHCSVTTVKDVQSWLERGVIQGGWSPFSIWSKCGEGLCGPHFKTRTRSCTDPPPANGGMICQGKNMECLPCGKTEKCPPVCAEWSMWSSCRNTSGVATQTRARECRGAKQCPTETKQVRLCDLEEVVWGPWSMCGCDTTLTNEINAGIQHRMLACASRCSNINGCQRGLVQYRPCPCQILKGPNISARVRQETKEQKKYEITDLILTSCITGIACLLISAVVVTLFIKRSKSFLNIAAKNERSGIDPEVLRSPYSPVKKKNANGGLVVNNIDQSCQESTPLTTKADIPEINCNDRSGRSQSTRDTDRSRSHAEGCAMDRGLAQETEKL